ncbi:hypothetical protein D9Q98_005069 [Chlorella vulgaris]|uniref:Uncharacterized protein n=1 Tax=Chlorella vulgaris TaxID=3077 RepID=A0A9D4TPQ5_CHLVU|nr:hypothetical protein D9Q98_005069 [Chlorella vulgaris]
MGTPGAEAVEWQVQVQLLTQSLEEERRLRRQAEDAAAAAAADATRLQRARDELATALLAAERRAAEAEEDQLRAESTAAALQQALREQQQAAEGADRQASVAAASVPPPSDAPQQSTLKQVPSLHQDSHSMAADLDILLTELDQERQRSEELVRTLEAAEREAVLATEKFFKAQQRIKQLESGGKRGLFGGKKAPALAAAALDPSEAGSATNLATAGGGEEAAAVQQLQQRIAALKASRDKLIGAFDAQAAEIERLSGDNAALAEATAQLRDVAAKWEAQAQDSLSQNERLKDLLEESATWSLPPAAPKPVTTPQASASSRSSAETAAHTAGAAAVPGPDGEGGLAATAAAGGDAAALVELCQRFERELLLEKAKSAQLDLQVRALCMELTRAAQSSSQMQAALLPMLGGIEARLVQVLGVRPRQAALQA